MGFSIVHFLLLGAIVALIFGPKPFQKAGRGAGDFWRGLKRGYDGKEDIDITDSVKREELNEPK
jgi:Sec-independent protein translocase protein TatA